jgi:hypothetical protein
MSPREPVEEALLCFVGECGVSVGPYGLYVGSANAG